MASWSGISFDIQKIFPVHFSFLNPASCKKSIQSFFILGALNVPTPFPHSLVCCRSHRPSFTYPHGSLQHRTKASKKAPWSTNQKTQPHNPFSFSISLFCIVPRTVYTVLQYWIAVKELHFFPASCSNSEIVMTWIRLFAAAFFLSASVLYPQSTRYKFQWDSCSNFATWKWEYKLERY